MDRNSVLAFLLIAIIILLMPEYYKLVYPDLDQTDSSRVETSGETTSKKSAKPADDVVLINENIGEIFLDFSRAKIPHCIANVLRGYGYWMILENTSTIFLFAIK